ncbi:GNAT family N-acetyltransferase [Macrococcus hajekii]|uniref:GNAT family N-acetyltransferase n=1 Tax=Macrococcus hajekii TaxID=198482 RepID=A0A4R6BM15_9STAP|nr:GNAT family N-acetyltransferase [Macrococcus hajekii]TDM02748.1 GNAT family N-acetyltransferase [Macrococcus hajekii]GGB03548.1 N-acetyltransferase [Macrococcus hajekii]
MDLNIKPFFTEDASEVAHLIRRATLETNINDYSQEDLEREISKITVESIIERASWTHFYVFRDADKIIATGAIGPYWDSLTESSFFTIFVLPEYQGKGIGRLIIETLENDDLYKRADRIEIPASITAVPFYQKFGYNLKPGVTTADEEGIMRMEKYKDVTV